MSYVGYYINLDRSPERRANMEAQLAHKRLEKKYRRFVAANGNTLNFPNPVLKDGEMGCFTSHYLLLKGNLGLDRPLHVVEDDALFAGCMEEAIDNVIASGAFGHYDIIYTDTIIPTASVHYKTYKTLFDKIVSRDEDGRIKAATFQIIDMQDKVFGTTTSFLVNPKSIQKLHDLYAAELAKGPDIPIDLFIRNLTHQNALKVGCIFPFVTSVRLDCSLNTTIEARYDQLPVLARNIVRYSFFIDRDLDECRRYIKEFLPLPDDPHLQILLHILGFSFVGMP